MIVVDTNILIAYLNGDAGKDMELLAQQLDKGQVWLHGLVLSELMAGHDFDAAAQEIFTTLARFRQLEFKSGYWLRAGLLRHRLRGLGSKAPLADCLIAQLCMDYDLPLLTRDADFQMIAKHSTLRLA